LTGTGPDSTHLAGWTLAVNDPRFYAAHLVPQTSDYPALLPALQSVWSSVVAVLLQSYVWPWLLYSGSLPVKVPVQTRRDPGGFGEDTRRSGNVTRRSGKLPGTMPHQAFSDSAGIFVVQRLSVSSGENMLLQTRQRRNYRLEVR
jgi:hypothetical protein